MIRSSGVPDWRSNARLTVCLPVISVIPELIDVVVMLLSVIVVFCVTVTPTVAPALIFGMLMDDTPAGSAWAPIRSAVIRPGRASATKSSTSHRGGANSPPAPAVVVEARVSCAATSRRRACSSPRPQLNRSRK